jgi:flagellar hook-associated protein 2
MAINSTGSTSSSGLINVAEIVSALMESRQAPLNRLNAEIQRRSVSISALGSFQSKVSVLQQALANLERASSFQVRTATSSDSSKFSASAAATASTGVYEIVVSQTALPKRIALSGFSSASESINLSSFSLTVGGNTYASAAVSGISTISGLRDWINTLSDDISANLVQGVSGKYELVLSSPETDLAVSGIKTVATGSTGVTSVTNSNSNNALNGDYTLTYNGVSWVTDPAGGTYDGSTMTYPGGSINISAAGTPIAGDRISFSIAGGSPVTFSLSRVSIDYGQTLLQSARNAMFTVDGVSVSRNSNSISDVIDGVTIDLRSAGSATLTVSQGANEISRNTLQEFVTAYNDLVSFYKTEAQRIAGAQTQGSLVGNSSVSQFMSQLRTLYSSGIRLATGATSSFTLFGIDLARDGTLSVNEGRFTQALADGLADKLAAGVQFGYQSASQNLGSFLNRAASVGGYFFSEIQAQSSQIRTLETRKASVESTLNQVRDRLTRQYAALDSQLLQLQNVSNSLTSLFTNLAGSNVRDR